MGAGDAKINSEESGQDCYITRIEIANAFLQKCEQSMCTKSHLEQVQILLFPWILTGWIFVPSKSKFSKGGKPVCEKYLKSPFPLNDVQTTIVSHQYDFF